MEPNLEPGADPVELVEGKQRKKRVWPLLAVLVLVLGVSGVVYSRLSQNAQLPEPIASQQKEYAGEEEDPNRLLAPDFEMVDAQGNSVLFSDLTGEKPVVLNFWASWCPPCKGEMPEFDQVYREMAGEVLFVMVDMVDGSRETEELGRAYIQEQGYAFPVYYDIRQEAAYAYGVASIPNTYFIDAEGYITAAARGAIEKETLLLGIQMSKGEA